MSHVGDVSGLEQLRVADTELLVRDGDGANTIMFLHGIGSRASSFADLMRAWPQGPRLVAWDMPGYGASKAVDRGWTTAADYAARLRLVCDDLRAEHLHLVGHSLGCLIAGCFAKTSGPRWGRVTFVSPALGYEVSPGTVLPDAHQQRIDDFKELGAAEFSKRRAARLVFEAEKHPGVVARVADTMASIAPEAYAQAVRMLASGQLLHDASQITVDAQVVFGSEDVVTPPANAHKLYNVLQERSHGTPHNACSIISGVGHAAYFEAPQKLTDCIQRFNARGAV